jgi:hypothetical protein
MSRRELVGAAYNPRTITPEARRKLRKNLERVGLLMPVVWNRRTRRLVAGHQRLSILDDLEGRDDYELDVAVVDLDEKTEQEQNVFLNNTEAQGDFDFDKLKAMFQGTGLDGQAAGFDLSDVIDLFGAQEQASEEIEELQKRMEEIHSVRNRVTAHSVRNRVTAKSALQIDFYCVLVFRGDAQVTNFLAQHGLPDGRYVNGEDLVEAIERRVAAARAEAAPDQAGASSARREPATS